MLVWDTLMAKWDYLLAKLMDTSFARIAYPYG